MTAGLQCLLPKLRQAGIEQAVMLAVGDGSGLLLVGFGTEGFGFDGKKADTN